MLVRPLAKCRPLTAPGERCQANQYKQRRTCCLLPPQLAPVPGSPTPTWSAAAWLGATRSASNATVWVDGGSPAAAALPWCPGEPNNMRGEEGCLSLLTSCSQGGMALLNDYGCDSQLRVLCAAPAAADCAGAHATRTAFWLAASRCHLVALPY
jgi:hypothetical protein